MKDIPSNNANPSLTAVDNEKLEFNARAKASMLLYLKSLSWPEKIASIERMNEAGRIARAAMKAARAKSILTR